MTPYSWLLQLYEKDWSRTYTSWTSPSCSCRHGVHDFHKFMGHWLIKIQKASSFIVLFGCGFTKYSYIGCLNKTIMHCFHFLYFVLKHRLYYLSVWVEYIDMWSCQWWQRVGGVQESHIFCSISLIFCSPLYSVHNNWKKMFLSSIICIFICIFEEQRGFRNLWYHGICLYIVVYFDRIYYFFD